LNSARSPIRRSQPRSRRRHCSGFQKTRGKTGEISMRSRAARFNLRCRSGSGRAADCDPGGVSRSAAQRSSSCCGCCSCSCTCAPFQCSSRAGSAAPGAGPAAGEESWLLRCAVELERWKNRELAACRVQCAHLDHLFLSNFVSCREKIPYQWHFLKTQRLAQRIQYKQADFFFNFNTF